MSVIANDAEFPGVEVTQFVEQVRIRLIIQKKNGISKVLQKLIRYYNKTAISTYLELSQFIVLNVNESLVSLSVKSTILSSSF